MEITKISCISKKKKKKKKSINDAKKFSEYFQAIDDPNDRFYQADEDVLYFNERYMQGELQIMFDELNLPITITKTRLFKYTEYFTTKK